MIYQTLAGCIVIAVLASCGDEGRFDAKTETQMFTIVRGELCDLYKRCPALWDDNNPPAEVTTARCEAEMDDPTNYQSTIDDSTRTQLDTCLNALEDSSCDSLETGMPSECDAVESYLDLK